MKKFSTFNDFIHLPSTEKTYVSTETTQWEVGRKGSGYVLELKKGETFDISNPSPPEWWPKHLYRCWPPYWFQSVHDRVVLPCAWIHDRLLENGFDPAFASSEFRRAAIARGKAVFWAWVLFFSTLAWTAFTPPKD